MAMIIFLAVIPFIFGVAGVAAFCAGSKDGDDIFASMIQ